MDDKWEALFQGKHDSREVCVTFRGSRTAALRAAAYYAQGRGMELVFMQAAGDLRSPFFGGVYA